MIAARWMVASTSRMSTALATLSIATASPQARLGPRGTPGARAALAAARSRLLHPGMLCAVSSSSRATSM